MFWCVSVYLVKEDEQQIGCGGVQGTSKRAGMIEETWTWIQRREGRKTIVACCFV